MITLEEALEIVQKKLSATCEGHTIKKSYGEVPNKYVFVQQDSKGIVPPGGWHWTVNKETGECKCEYLEREFLAPYAPIKGYKKIELED